MNFKQELIDLPLIAEKTADKILAYAPTKDILIEKLKNNYEEMISLFRDNVVELLKKEYLEVKNEQKTEGNKQNDESLFIEKNSERFVHINKDRIQYDCPKCGNYIQVVIGSACPHCKTISQL